MTLTIAILATITATLVMATKLIELRTAQLKLRSLEIPQIKTSPQIANAIHVPNRFVNLRAYGIPALLTVVTIASYATRWVDTALGSSVVGFCLLATPYFLFMPFIKRFIRLFEMLTFVVAHDKLFRDDESKN